MILPKVRHPARFLCDVILAHYSLSFCTVHRSDIITPLRPAFALVHAWLAYMYARFPLMSILSSIVSFHLCVRK
ncbi:hypothetical protein BC629DRAFT_1533079 [Irpex lacteus]|nr:hypothetical protein BC629DRAFT_1533079 [Irpex lacteus]